MLNTSVSIDELRTNLSELIGRVMYGGERVVVKKYNREAAVLLSMDEYERLVDPTKRFTKEQWNKKFAFFDTIRDRISPRDQKALEGEIDKAVREVRAEKKKRYERKT